MFDTNACDDAQILTFFKTGYILGNVLNLYLYGILTVQIYLYYVSFPRDRRLFKAITYTVCAIETIATAVLTNDFGHIVADPPASVPYTCSTICPTIVVLALCAGTVTFLTQCMYAYRIRIITKQKYLMLALLIMIGSQLVVIIIISSLRSRPSMTFVILVWTIVSLTVDIVITGTMLWTLKGKKIEKSFERKATRLIYFIIGTGVLTVAINICVLVLLFVSPGYSIGLSIFLSKVYANAAMVLSNHRIISEKQDDSTTDMSDVQFNSIHTISQASGEGDEPPRGLADLVNIPGQPKGD